MTARRSRTVRQRGRSRAPRHTPPARLSPGPAPFPVKHDGNLTMDQIIEIAKTLRPRSLSHKMSGSVKEILGTCLCVAALPPAPAGGT